MQKGENAPFLIVFGLKAVFFLKTFLKTLSRNCKNAYIIIVS